jgi:hypothetical protein
MQLKLGFTFLICLFATLSSIHPIAAQCKALSLDSLSALSFSDSPEDILIAGDFQMIKPKMYVRCRKILYTENDKTYSNNNEMVVISSFFDSVEILYSSFDKNLYLDCKSVVKKNGGYIGSADIAGDSRECFFYNNRYYEFYINPFHFTTSNSSNVNQYHIIIKIAKPSYYE